MASNRAEVPLRRLMGPGPLNIHPRIYQALTAPILGHLDPAHLKILDQVGELLRQVFGTQNRVTNTGKTFRCPNHRNTTRGK